MGAEVHEYGGLALDANNAAKAILVVCHQIRPLVYLGRFLDDGDIEGATRQVPSRRAGARWFHSIHSTRIAPLRGSFVPDNQATASLYRPGGQARSYLLTSGLRW